MASKLIRLGGAVGLWLLAAAAIARTLPPSENPAVETAPEQHVDDLAELGLDQAQTQKIEQLRARERRRVELLRIAHTVTEQKLRRAELAQPFDAQRVGGLVATQAEIAAYLRGTESRLVSEIAAVLTREQRSRFAELRAAGASATPPATVLPRTRGDGARGTLEARLAR